MFGVAKGAKALKTGLKSHQIFYWMFPIILGFFWIWFCVSIDQRTLWGDQYGFLERYMAISKGDQSWTGVWNAKSGHRLPVYLLLFMANVKFFGFEPLLETIPAITTFTICVIYLVSLLAKSLSLNKFFLILFAVTATLWFMNGQSLTLSVYSTVAMRLFNFTLFVALAATTYNFLSGEGGIALKSRKFWAFIALTFVAIILFGRGYGMGAGAGVFAVTFVYLVSHRFAERPAKKAGIVFVVLTLTIGVYLTGITGKASHAISSGFDLTAFVDFYLKRLGSAVLASVDANYLISNIDHAIGGNPETYNLPEPMRDRLSIWTRVIAILYLLTAAIISIWAMRRRVIPKAHWLALFLIYFSLFGAFTVAIARFNQSPYTIRHTFELSVGMVGILYFLFFAAAHFKQKWSYTGISILGGCVVMFSGWTLLQAHNYQQKWEAYFDRTAFYVHKSVQEGATADDYRSAHCKRKKKDARVIKTCGRIFKFIKDENIMPRATNPAEK